MKKQLLFLLLAACFSFYSCIKEPSVVENDYEGNFESLWKIVDTRYCYLAYKNINWDSIHQVYAPKVQDVEDDREFFDLMAAMLGELKDGHVNLYSDFDVSRYWNWYLDYPENFDSKILYSDKYIGRNYKISGGMHYEKISGGEIGYIYYGSFMSGFSNQRIQQIFDYFEDCKGLIIDVRNNGGGSLLYSEMLASYFFDQTQTTGYMAHKSGDGHQDFSEPKAVKTYAHSTVNWKKKVVVLSNRHSYSATNDFVNRMKSSPYATIVGDKTGGGGGMPLSSEIPIGWMVRFSACPMFDLNMQHIEWGIDPDVKIDMDTANPSEDAIIETAIRIISDQAN